MTEILFSSGVLEGAAADGVEQYEQQEDDHVEERDLVPHPPHVLEHARFAGVAVVAQHCRRVVPLVAVRVLRHHCLHVVDARRRWLTASRLHLNATSSLA